ncbi:MAG TPA: IS630 family transposase [Micromonosporaceae bacterium]|nr:IS630 family transposase [Micromonosporaceae bacterium]
MAVPRARSADVVRLSTGRRRRLVHLSRRSTAPAREVRRARILLAAAQGQTNAAIARQVGCDVATVRRTRRHFRTRGMKALRDRPRTGRPLVYDLDVRLLVIATATSQPPETDAQWTHRLIAGHLHATHGIGISQSQVGRILTEADIKPHRVRGWLNRPDDPAFFTRAQAICHLYQHIPDGTVLLSVDEKTGIQARSRTRPTQPVRAGRPARREFEYRRHGTVSLMAAMDVATGKVHPKIISRNDSATFIAFLEELDQAIDKNLRIHLVIDNGSSHTSKATRAWLAAHPRFAVTYTPKHASWLNMIEIFFSILTRRLLRRGELTSRDHLTGKILNFIAEYSRTAKPFRWRYDGRPLKAA